MLDGYVQGAIDLISIVVSVVQTEIYRIHLQCLMTNLWLFQVSRSIVPFSMTS